jgi:hypothetical protein
MGHHHVEITETCSGYETENKIKEIKTIRNIVAIDCTPKVYINRRNRLQP